MDEIERLRISMNQKHDVDMGRVRQLDDILRSNDVDLINELRAVIAKHDFRREEFLSILADFARRVGHAPPLALQHRAMPPPIPDNIEVRVDAFLGRLQ